MGIRDLFKKSPPTDAVATATSPDLPAGLSALDAAYLRAVCESNQALADQIAAGQTPDMPADQQAWFTANAGKPVNPIDIGYMWYAHQDAGRMQLVSHEMLKMTNMDVPANQPGIHFLVS